MQPKTMKSKNKIFLKLEDDPNFFEKGRRPQFFEKNNSTKTIKSKNNGCGTAPGNLVIIIYSNILCSIHFHIPYFLMMSLFPI